MLETSLYYFGSEYQTIELWGNILMYILLKL